MPFQIGDTIIDDNIHAYALRQKIEFLFLSEYQKYQNDLNENNDMLLKQLASCLIQMPTNGAFDEMTLQKACLQLDIQENIRFITDQPFYKKRWFKVHIHLMRAIITRCLRAIENAILTWGDPNHKIPNPIMITLLYLAWIYPFIRLSSNLFVILQYITGIEGTPFEKSLSWKERAKDQAQRFWQEVLIDVLWITIRGLGCIYPLPTPPPLSITLFGSRVIVECASTLHAQYTLKTLSDSTLKKLILKDRITNIGIWVSYFAGAIPGLINSFGLTIGSLWIAVTCIGQLLWEFIIRETPMALKIKAKAPESTSNNSFLLQLPMT